jgi:hypothetical protein
MNNFTTFFEKNSRIQNYVSRKFMVFAILITFSTNGFAASGLFDAYAIFSINNGANTYRQYSAVQGWSIGSFTYGSTSLILNGAQNKTFKNGISNVTGGQIAYRVYLTSTGPGSVPFSFIQLSFGENYGTPGDQRWETNNANVNLLNGLNVGTYTFEAYFQAYTSDGNSFYSNSSANYKASFTITKATPSLTTAPTALSILSGETLASSSLSGGVASVAGSFAFTTPSTAPTATGNHSVTFTPTNSANYNNFTTTVNVPVITSTTWDGASWSEGNPTPTLDAIIDGTYSTDDFRDGTIDAKSLTVTATRGNLTIYTGTKVTVQNAVTNNGTITIENNANLIQVNNVSNTGSGTTTVNRNGSTLKRLDYTLWSSPVAAQNLKGFSSLTVDPRFYTYNEGSDKFSVVGSPSGTTFTPGRSFFIRMPDVYPEGSNNQTPYYLGNTTLAYQGVFTGTLNNGNVPVTLTKALNGYQAVGNPYPSVIDAQTFVTANTANIENTLYFWRKTNLASGSSYATWTSGGATSVTPTSGTPNGKIQVGQGFIVQAKQAGTVANFFTNSMREAAPTSTQFFKVKQEAQKDRLWLNLTGANDVFSQALVAYVADGSLGLDQYDGKYINDSDIALTSSIAGTEYTIQGRPAFDATDVVALNFKTSVAGAYTIAIDHVDGLFSKGQDIYLVDKKVGVTTNLNEGAYNFTAEAGVDNTRFELTYQKTLKVDAPLFNENSVLVSRSNGTVNVKSNTVAINNVKVYDIQGRLVAERKNVKSNSASFSNLKVNQVLIVKVTAENNAVVTKKVLN